MTTKTMTFQANGEPVALKLRAGYANLKLKVDPDVRTGTITLTGPQSVLDETEETKGDPGAWDVLIPNARGGGFQINSFSSDGSVSTVISGGRFGGTVIQGGRMVISNMSLGGRSGGVGRVVVDGVDVTEYVNGQRGSGAVEDTDLTVDVVLPAGSSVDLDVADGDVELSGDMDAKVQTSNADVTVKGLLKDGTIKSRNGDIRVMAAWDVTLETHNGNVDLGAASGQTMATSHNGNVRVCAVADVIIMATSHNGNVDVAKAAGTNPRIIATSHNGSVRKP